MWKKPEKQHKKQEKLETGKGDGSMSPAVPCLPPIVLNCPGCYNESRISKKAGEEETGKDMSVENGEWIMRGMAWDDQLDQ